MYIMSLENKSVSKIIGIQFSLLSPEEIIRNSVAEIKYKETYNGLKPKTGGLFDLRMGTLEPGIICPTDNLNYLECPGYFGHIVLAKPVFYIQYLTTITQILKSVCFKCSKLLVDKNEFDYIKDLPASKRWSIIHEACSKSKRCGDNTSNGCGCMQPEKIKRDGFATLIGEWPKLGSSNMTLKFTPEIILKIFKKITDEDVDFMGFSSKWSRPEWMICSVFAVPPPACRPSVKVDSQQRSEDDLTHIIINIIKYNNNLKEQMDNTDSNVDDWVSLLQYYVACLADNNIPGTHPVTQRSGRPLKSITERHKGKTGRIRGNLMGKRVDFSARSVITPDPELSIVELGVPKKIAMNITKPVHVNKKNKNYLLYLIQNGPDHYPGAKILERKNGENISLRYVNRDTISINDGDIVHRHMLDGDYVLFNRQPTLHRMSMMAHKVKVLLKGDTFRMNVAVTKPYNADFDGDEMNMHMPQNDEAEVELMNLAAIPYQIISPGNNTSIIGIFQDSLLGSYLFTEENVEIDRQEAMNILSKTVNPDLSIFEDKKKMKFKPQEIISCILPEISIKYTDPDKNIDVNVVNGKMVKGQIEKSFFGGGRGLIQRINNDFSQLESQIFIDDIQSIITEYMKHRGFSVGISDLIADENTKDLIKKSVIEKKTKVLELIDDIKSGVFENKTHHSNKELFEAEVNNLLNSATQDAGKLGIDNLDKNNRFVKIVSCGSKGSNINICQMISCVGQQSIDNKRIPYNYNNRTLPHYTQFDDSMEARGFVENSFIEGLTPEELYFHAMSGRVGIIDTAVKTSTTGYIQRRLIKGMEDLNCAYDGTIRNSKQKIVQFRYGTTMDTVHMEAYEFKLLTNTVAELYEMYNIDYNNKSPKVFNAKAAKPLKDSVDSIKERIKHDVEYLLNERDYYINYVNENISNKKIYMSVHFKQIINNITTKFSKNRLCDVSILEFYKCIDKYYDMLDIVYSPCRLFKVAYYYYLNPKHLLYELKINKDTLIYLLETIILRYKKSLLNPGEMVGMISAQSIGEPTTQMTLNTFHYAGVASKANVTRGVPRMEELLTITPKIKNPSVTIYLKPDEETDKEKATDLISQIEHTKLNTLIKKCEIYYDPNPLTGTTYTEDNDFMDEYKKMCSLLEDCVEEDTTAHYKWVLRMELDKSQMINNNITVQFIHYALKKIYDDKITCYYNDMNETKIIFKIKLSFPKNTKTPLDASDHIYIIKSFQDKLLNEIAIRGIENIDKVNIREIPMYLKYNDETLDFDTKKIWVLDTVGSNLQTILSLDDIDVTRTYSNSITEMKEVLGIEAARKIIFNEIKELMDDAGSYINYHHISLLADRMCYNDKLVSIFRHGINNDDIGPIAKASFEETTEMFLKAARHGELDQMKGVSANIMCGQEGYYGTSAFSVFLNNIEIDKMVTEYSFKESKKDILEDLYSSDKKEDTCNNIDIKHNLHAVSTIIPEADGDELDI